MFKLRGSSGHALMVGRPNITENQLKELEILQAKERTAKQEVRMFELMEKKNKPFELSETAKSAIKKQWLWDKYRYDKPVYTPEIIKGILCEQDTFKLVDKVLPLDELRLRNTEKKENDYFKGTPDFVSTTIPDLIEDVKSSWDLHTFMEADLNPIYYGQGQIYMHLWERDSYRLIYGLVDTPEHLVRGEKLKIWYKFDNDSAEATEHEDYQIAAQQIEINHKFEHIPIEDRIKVFEFDYDPDYIDELIRRMPSARDYYDNLKLNK